MTPEELKTEICALFVKKWIEQYKKNPSLKTNDPVELLVAKYVSINTILNLKNQ